MGVRGQLGRPVTVAVVGLLLLSACNGDEPGEDSGGVEDPDVDESDADESGVAFPEEGETLELIVPYGPGGGVDTAARGMAPLLQEELGIDVIVENVPGAGATIGATQVYREEGNPYTLLLDYTPGRSIGELMLDADMDALGFEAIYGFTQVFTAVTVAADSEYETMSDLMANMPVSAGNPGEGSPIAFTGLILNEETELQFDWVPYDGLGEARAAIEGGEVVTGLVNTTQVADSDGLRALAITEGEAPELPDAPSLAEELGTEFPQIPQLGGFWAPPGIDQEAIEVLREALGSVIQSDEWAEFAEESGAFTHLEVTPEELEEGAREGHEVIEQYLPLVE